MIDDFLDEIERSLVGSRRRRARIMSEVRDHLDDATARFVERGADRSAAEAQAIGAFGRAGDLARQFNTELAGGSLRRVPLTMAAAGTLVIAGFVSAASVQPRTHAPVTIARQIAFFVAMLGLQFAFAAGLRVVARVAAMWRSTPSAADQALVWRASHVFVGGLAVCVAGLLAALAGRQTEWRAPQVIVGAVVMVAATVAAIWTARRRVVSDGEPNVAAPGGRPVLGFAERLTCHVSHRPRLSCAVVAFVAAAAAMSHAETTWTGALPWGAAEAAAVIGGFVWFGPSLEVRSLSRSR